MKKDLEIKSKLQSIKLLLDNPKNLPDNLSENVLEDLFEEKNQGKKLDNFFDKKKKKVKNKKDIFTKLNDLADSFITDKKTPKKDKYGAKKKIKRIANESMRITVNSVKDILLNNIVEVFFVGEGICGRNANISINNISLKVNEIDFLNTLTIDPTSDVGKIIYEEESLNIGRQKVNRNLYSAFSSSPYNFTANNNNILFTATWNESQQIYDISGLKQNSIVKVEDFFIDYFSSIELPDISGITKNALLLTLQPGQSVNIKFKEGLVNLDKLTKKLFAACGNATDRENLKKQNPVNLFDNSDEDESSFFDFDNIEDYDFSIEDAKFRSVLKFVDCDNFEVPINENILEEFVFFSSQKNIDDLVEETIEKTASDSYEQSEGNIDKHSFEKSLMSSYISNLPKSLMMSIVTPKFFLPIVIIYKMFKSTVNQFLEIKDLMKRLYKLFVKIIKELFWKFIQEFWKRLKIELINFLRQIVTQILKSKYKRYITILTSIFNLLKNLTNVRLDNCDNLFDTISKAIETALSARSGINVPGFLLGFSDLLPGFSKESALLNINQRLEAYGISTGPIYNEDNNIPKIMKSMLDGFFEEMDKNSFVKASNKQVTIPTPIGPIIIPPGLINTSGKLF